MSRGTTLPELLIVVVLIGLLAGFGAPRLQSVLDRLAVERAAQVLLAAHRQARAAGQLTGHPAVLRIRADSLLVGVVTRGDTLPFWASAGPAADAVALSGSTRSILVAPSGLGLGFSNGTWHLTRGAARRDVVFSRLGRVRIVRP